MNMCMIQDDKGNVLALDKVNDSYTGQLFQVVICGAERDISQIYDPEVWEETGLTIEKHRSSAVYIIGIRVEYMRITLQS